MQGYDLELRHILGKKNPADSLSRQHFAEACKQRLEVKEEEKDLVNVLLIKPQAKNDEIQDALPQIFAGRDVESDALSVSKSKSDLISVQAQYQNQDQNSVVVQ